MQTRADPLPLTSAWIRQRPLLRVLSFAEDSPSGLWRTLGKRVGVLPLAGSNPASSAGDLQPFDGCRALVVRPDAAKVGQILKSTVVVYLGKTYL